MNSLVSIITPSFNQGQFLEATIQSVLDQTYKNIEYIVIDGGSTDSSIEIIKKYERNISYWISEKDKGQADAINKGFVKAKGDYICWVNSDDLLYSNFISDRIKHFSEHENISMIYGDVHQGWDINSKKLRKGSQQSWKEMITTGMVNVPQMSAIWKREVLSSIGGLNVSFTVLLDWEYFVRIAKTFRILYIPDAVAFFRQHKDSKSVNLISSWAGEMIQYYEKNIFLNSDIKQINIKITRQNLYLFCAGLYKEVENEKESSLYFKMAKTVSPIRFYWKAVLKKSIQLLVTVKKKMKI